MPPTTNEQAAARARLEFRANESGFARVGLTENEFVAAELARQGFSAPPPIAAPSWLASGLAMTPNGDEMNADHRRQ